MGVDYSGHYGIGIGVEPIDFDDENLSSEVAELECMCEFLDEKLDAEKLRLSNISKSVCHHQWINSGLTIQGKSLKVCLKCRHTEQTVC